MVKSDLGKVLLASEEHAGQAVAAARQPRQLIEAVLLKHEARRWAS